MDKAIFRNFAINFTGLILPTFVSLVTVPTYIRLLGTERYGILTLVGVYIVYFGMLDLGMGIATENRISRAHLVQDDVSIDRVFWSACWSNLATGTIGAGIMYFGAAAYANNVATMPDEIRQEVIESLPWLALCIPVAILSTVFVAAISGTQRFTLLNVNQTIATFTEQLVPIVVIWRMGPRLSTVIAAIAIVRLAAAVSLCLGAMSVLNVRRCVAPEVKTIRKLFGYGSWIMLTTFLTTVVETLDTVLLGTLMGGRFVTFYSVPQNLVTRLNLLPLSLTRTLFPRLVACERANANEIASKSLTFLTAIFTPAAIVAMFAISPFLTIWLGQNISIVSSPVGRTLIVAVWIFGQSNVIRVLIQAQNNPATLARLALIEMPFFVAALWFAISEFGITGASVVVVARGLFDYGILLYLSGINSRRALEDMLLHLAFLCVSLYAANSISSLPLLAGTGLLILGGNTAFSFYRSPGLRDMAFSAFSRLGLGRST